VRGGARFSQQGEQNADSDGWTFLPGLSHALPANARDNQSRETPTQLAGRMAQKCVGVQALRDWMLALFAVERGIEEVCRFS
jgi:hypothetical protein